MIFWLDEHGFIDNELADVLCSDELRVAIVDNLVDDLIDQHEVLANALLVQHAAVVPEYLHHSVDNVENGRRRHIRLACRHEVDSELLREEIIDSIDMLYQKFQTGSGTVEKSGKRCLTRNLLEYLRK